MADREKIAIHSFNEFLDKFQMFYFAGDSIRPSLCLQDHSDYFWTFEGGYNKEALNKDILANKNLFDWHKTSGFYYPNTNMFSKSNEERGIKGFIVRSKQASVKIREAIDILIEVENGLDTSPNEPRLNAFTMAIAALREKMEVKICPHCNNKIW